jgi:hypothetical protein
MGGRSRTRFSPDLETGRLSVGSPIGKAARDGVLRRPPNQACALARGLHEEDGMQLVS